MHFGIWYSKIKEYNSASGELENIDEKDFSWYFWDNFYRAYWCANSPGDLYDIERESTDSVCRGVAGR